MFYFYFMYILIEFDLFMSFLVEANVNKLRKYIYDLYKKRDLFCGDKQIICGDPKVILG